MCSHLCLDRRANEINQLRVEFPSKLVLSQHLPDKHSRTSANFGVSFRSLSPPHPKRDLTSGRLTRCTSLAAPGCQHNHGRNRLSRSQPGCLNKPRQVCDAWYLRRPRSHLSSRRHLWGRWHHPGVAHPDRQITGMEGSLEENQRILCCPSRAEGGSRTRRGPIPS
jgi:hypothetical protein